MRFVSRTAVAALLLAPVTLSLAVTPALAQKKDKKSEAAAAQAGPKLNASKDFIPLYQAADKAIKAKDTAGAQTAIAAAVAGAKTDDDRYFAAQLYIQLGKDTNSNETIVKGLEMLMPNPLTPAADKANYGLILGKVAYGNKDYAGAAKLLAAARTAGAKDPDLDVLLSDALSRSGDTAGALAITKQTLDAAQASGQPAPERLIRSALQQSMNAKDQAGIATYSRMLVQTYPTAESWKIALKLYRDNTQLDEGDNLDLMRLLRVTGGMESERDYAEYAQSAGPARLPGEVASVLQEGLNKRAFQPSQQTLAEYLSQSKGAVAADKASLASSEADAAKTTNPKVVLGAADVNFSYGNYAKAATFYQKLAGMGSPDADRANLRLGMSKSLGGDKAGAVAAFDAVTGPNRKMIAGFWKLYGEKGVAAAPAAAPATSAGATVSTPTQ